jgi:hypothetical protein
MSRAAATIKPRWLIDTHGMRDALKTKKNSVRDAVISAIESGEMHILKAVSAELKDLYPEIYPDFQAIKKKKYVPVSVAASAAAAMMMEVCNVSPLGSVLPVDRFESLAASRILGSVLVSSGKACTDAAAIAKSNSLPNGAVIDVESFV